MAKVPNWMHHDNETDAAKGTAWHAVAGEQPPHRAWYYSSTFQEDQLGPLLVALRDVFWSPATKRRVVKDVDVKVEYQSILPGVPILRVTMPERLVASFVGGDSTFVLYKVMRGDKMVDFGHEWGGLRSVARGGSKTVVGNLGSMMDGLDMPPPAALLREAEIRAAPVPPVRPAPASVAVPASRPASPVRLVEAPHPPAAVPDPTEADGSAPPPRPPEPLLVEPERARVITVARPPRQPRPAGWDVFGGKPAEPPERLPEPPNVRSVTPSPAPAPRPAETEDDDIPGDDADRTFGVIAALMVVLVILLAGSYFLSAS